MTALDWAETEAALALLAELDACERSSDHWYGKGEIARAFTERCQEIESELDDLRSEAVNAFADASGHERWTELWDEAWAEADAEAETVSSACQCARRNHMGDHLIEQAAAA
jgi:hypothetical protein